GAEASPRAWERSMRRHDLRSMVRRRPFAWLRWARWLTRPLAGRGPVADLLAGLRSRGDARGGDDATGEDATGEDAAGEDAAGEAPGDPA
ncbi:MAG: hypothetical protein Q7T15_03665, partial [Microcella sp.]|nr:hypothetical protein [Microcella sp.]